MNLTRRRTAEPVPQRILVVRNDRLGDVVLTLPALAALRKAVPQAHVSILASEYTAPLLEHCQLVDDILIDDGTTTSRALGHWLRGRQFDVALVVNTNTRNVRAVWAAGIRVRVCWAYKPWGWLLGNRMVRLHRSHPPVHESQFAFEFVRQVVPHAVMPAATPELDLDPEMVNRVRQRIRRLVGSEGPLFGVHPGSFKSAYNWPPDYYAELVMRLALRGRVVVTGGPSERALVDQVLAAANSRRAAGLCDLSLPELAALLSQLDVLTASSTGPMHLAGICGTPVVALFSGHAAHSPLKWAPLGRGHTILRASTAQGRRLTPEQALRHMTSIGVDDVVGAVLRYMPPAEQLACPAA